MCFYACEGKREAKHGDEFHLDKHISEVCE